MTKFTNIGGQIYGKLTAIQPIKKMIGKSKRGITFWIFQCECGNLIEHKVSRVTDGHVKSCGCASHPGPGQYSGVQSIEYAVYKKTYADGDLSFKDFCRLIKLNCYYCGSPPSNLYHRKNKKVTYELSYSGLDRLDNKMTHNLDNVVPCCFDCNKFKSKRTAKNFINHITRIYQHIIGESNGII